MTQPQTIRVHQLARELSLTPQALLSLLPKLPQPIPAETIMAHLTMKEVDYIRAQVLSEGEVPPSKVDTDIFGELRSLLAKEPSPQVWTSMLQVVQRDPQPQVIQYLQDQLRGWPTQIPRKPSKEIWLSLVDEPHPALALCDTLIFSELPSYAELYPDQDWLDELANDEGPLPEPTLIYLIVQGYFSTIRTLDLSHVGLSARSVIALASSPHSNMLRALNLSYNKLNPEAIHALGHSPHLLALERLELEGVKVFGKPMYDIYQSPLGQRLKLINTGDLREDIDACSRPLVLERPSRSWPQPALDERLADELIDMLLLEPKRVASCSPQEQLRSAQALRDLYFLARQDDASEALRQQVRQASALLPALDPFVIEGQLKVSWHPSQRHKQLRLLPSTSVSPAQRALCHHTRCLDQEFVAVFADPQELNYQCFENILPLDALFEREDLSLSPGQLTPLYLASKQQAYTLKLQPSQAATDTFSALSKSELYLPPSPGSSRGGQRFIFHSASLAKVLTQTLKASLPASCLGDGFEAFVHVNPVFRFNRFRPGDEPFHAHLDTPYYDAGRGHISRYTLLLYLSGGSADAALTLDELTLTDLEEMTCVIFDQRIEHEGAPYLDGDKLFLRTELIFTARKLEHRPDIAQHFSKACYLNNHCVVFPELAQQMGMRYEQAARAHWGLGATTPQASEPYLHKRYRGVEFFTNGWDFWCSSSQLDLKEAAALAILDHLNCHIDEEAFHTLCQSEVVSLDADDPSAWMIAKLSGLEPPAEPLFWTLYKENICSPSQRKPDEFCCPFHHREDFDAMHNADVLRELRSAQKTVAPYLWDASIYMFGDRIYLDPERVVVTPDKIFALSHKAPTPINFAACWNDESSPELYLDVATTAQLPFLLVPPLLYQERQGCYHLRLDLFKNDWMLDRRQLELPLPKPDLAWDGIWLQEWERALQGNDEDDEDDH